MLKALKITVVAISIFALAQPLSATMMRKEINEQPNVIIETSKIFYKDADSFQLPKLPIAPHDIKRIEIVACGTSYHAGLVSEPWFEKYAHLPVKVSVASEFVKHPMLEDPKHTLVIFISQSGETTHTLDALKYAKSKGYPTLSIVNCQPSSIADTADLSFCTQAGDEVSVAATKSFTTQLSVLAHLAVGLGQDRGTLKKVNAKHALSYLKGKLSADMKIILSQQDKLNELGQLLATKSNMFCLGSGSSYGLARETALKLKETSYFHAEAVPVGELKHGPLAMLDKDSVAIIVASPETSDQELTTMLSEIAKREAPVILISETSRKVGSEFSNVYRVNVPYSHPDLGIIAWAVPIQQIALARSLARGLNPDSPRDLVKAVVTG